MGRRLVPSLRVTGCSKLKTNVTSLIERPFEFDRRPVRRLSSNHRSDILALHPAIADVDSPMSVQYCSFTPSGAFQIVVIVVLVSLLTPLWTDRICPTNGESNAASDFSQPKRISKFAASAAEVGHQQDERHFEILYCPGHATRRRRQRSGQWLRASSICKTRCQDSSGWRRDEHYPTTFLAAGAGSSLPSYVRPVFIGLTSGQSQPWKRLATNGLTAYPCFGLYDEVAEREYMPLTSNLCEAASPTITQSSTSSVIAPAQEHNELPIASAQLEEASGRPSSPSSQPSKMGRGEGPIAHEKVPTHQRPPNKSSVSAPAGKIPRLPLEDISQYTDAILPTAAVTASSTTLAELGHLVRLQTHQDQKRFRSRVRLHRCLVSSALSARLARCGNLAYRTLIDSFRSDDKKTFATLYNALHDVRNSCDATRRHAMLEADLDVGKPQVLHMEQSRSLSTFMHRIPSKIRDQILEFISKIRNEPDFLAGRICSLSTSDLSTLASFHQSLEPIESVMPLSSRGKVPGSGSLRNQAHSPNPVERLLSLQRHDPLSALLYTIFPNSSGPDSAEDLRRSELWSTTCARLITEGTPGGEQFMRVVLNTWASMREWPAKESLELYLMRTLQDGAFLLEKGEDQPTGVRPQSESRNAKDAIAAEDFYDLAVKRLFEVVDDEPSAGGIPEGVLEIGNSIMRKLEDSKKQRAAQTFIVSKWFFSTFLMNTIIYPESRGIMTGHHIGEYARQKILKEVAFRAQKHVWDMTFNWKQAAPILPEIRTHIENILARFRSSRTSRSRPVLLPATAITSPRETVEVMPFLVMSASDVVTLVNTLFPERRPVSSSLQKDLHQRGLKTTTSSVSGASLHFQSKPFQQDGLDTSSMLSNSGSSITSDMTSREPLLDTPGQSADGLSSCTSFGSQDTLHTGYKLSTVEEYGRKLKSAVSEMSRHLGYQALTGSCHPCAENWAVLYISLDGTELMTRLPKDWDENEEDEDSPDSDSEEEATPEKSDLEKDYHQLKNAIIKLVEQYEIPKELSPESESKEFSNRPSKSRKRTSKRAAVKASALVATTKPLSKNPYHSQSHLSSLIASHKQAIPDRRRSQIAQSNSVADFKQTDSSHPSVLLTMLEAAVNQCQSRSDFVTAHLYFKTLQQLRRLSPSSLTRDGYGPLLSYFSRGSRDSLGRSASVIEEFEAWFVWLKQSQERQDTMIEEMMSDINELRDKMWYVTDVKNSAAYEEAKNIAMAIKTMGQSRKSSQGKGLNSSRTRNVPRSYTAHFLLKTETQIMDLMTATREQGGPSKLSDDQSELTVKWLTRYGIENFCKGEERIHRFCLEIDKCVNKLVGNDILDGPVLWSSELYSRDKHILDTGRQKGDLFMTGIGTLSIAGDDEYEMGPGRSSPRSNRAIRRSSSRDLREISTNNASQQSFDSGRWSGTRGNSSIELMDSQDYFGVSSPLFSIDSSTTFWSPFQSQRQSSSGATSIRAHAGAAGHESVMPKNSEIGNTDRQRFLLDLKQNLTGLLISDLGTLVWSHGSETDLWFSGDLGEECMHRKTERDRRRRRALAKKRSLKNLRSGKTDPLPTPLEALGRDERSQLAAPVATLEHAGHDHHSTGETSSSSDATARSSKMATATPAGFLEFPYDMAFGRLLRTFSTHPNPFTKLHALYELETLIVASLSSRSGQAGRGRRDTLPIVPSSPTQGVVSDLGSREASGQVMQARNLDEAIANCEERRSHIVAKTGAPPFRSSVGSQSANNLPSRDMIVEVLQGLFRDSSTRPKTLFRDLQFIAAFVPVPILEKTDHGKAFWDAGLAALGLKQDVCRMMVEIADDIVAYQTKNRSLSPTRSAIEDQPPELARFSMEDAARMWSITAKEGDPVAQRELAIFYLTHPELLARITSPLSRPRDIFKPQVMNQRNEDPTRSDPATMCVAYHWMELSSQGGDDLARKYLRSREELNALP
ncbi:MAG: hypothetical protein M1837_002627 [Sclerophora amabilis]|nr:MAG: hypothetical protein M1837_002627 [Sclerophora amabilis]